MKYKGCKEHIKVYWWNHGTKTLDYEGPIDGFLEKKGITVRKLKKRNQYDNRWRFRLSTSSTSAEVIIQDVHFYTAAELAAQMFLTMMGDKALVIGRYTRRINWR